ncbi:MAG: zinc ribbon domain-containing protein [Oscillospiraceae bacterium]|nr:zinc ribbon domain-containing protein [Oscillospiraceae bacterium]
MSKICQSCGQELHDGAQICELCGAQLAEPPSARYTPPPPQPPPQQQYRQQYQPAPPQYQPQQEYQPSTTQQPPQQGYQQLNYTLNAGGKSFNAAVVVQVIAVALIAIFFFPLFRVGFDSLGVSFSGFETAFGKNIDMLFASERIDGNLMAIFLLLIPAAIFVLFLFKNKSAFIANKLFVISCGLSALGVAAFVAFTLGVRDVLGEMPRFSFWYYLAVVLYIAAGVISAVAVSSLKKAAQQRSGI